MRAFAVFLVALGACGGGGTSLAVPSAPVAPTPITPVARVAVTPNAATLSYDATQLLTATTFDANGAVLAGRAITWESGYSAVATVSATGLVAARCYGTSSIKATSEGISGTSTVLVDPPLTMLRYDVAAGVSCVDEAAIRQGIEKAQTFLTTNTGGDVPASMHPLVTVKVVATGLGNQSPGGGGACCTSQDTAGMGRPFFDVKHPNWDISKPPGIATWSIFANKEKTAAHEYVHVWAWSLGGLPYSSERLGDWLTEGLAEYLAYSTMVRLGQMRAEDVDAFMLSSAVITGEAAQCLSSLEQDTTIWPGHSGYLAVRHCWHEVPVAYYRFVPSTRIWAPV